MFQPILINVIVLDPLDRLAELVLQASVTRATDLGSILAFPWIFFQVESHQ